jgi:hypothetical protein
VVDPGHAERVIAAGAFFRFEVDGGDGHGFLVR